MTASENRDEPPLAEPGKRQAGGDVGGVASTIASGAADWAQRSSERADAPAVAPASTGDGVDAAAGQRIDRGGHAAPGDAGGASAPAERPVSDAAASAPAAAATAPVGRAAAGPTDDDGDDEEPWRHEPVAPVDETNPIKSLGKAVADTVTGSGDKPDAPKR
jgi:hypothetical protein